MDNDKVKLYEFILDQYSLSELKDLCFYLDVTFDDLEGGARKDKARELVEYMTRRKRLDDLRALLNQQRPDDYRATFTIAPATPVAAPNSTTTRRNPRQIFISHATADSALAHRLAADLRRDGFDIWIAPESIRPGEQWVRAISRGLEESGVMVLVLTPAAAASPWVEMETNVAIELERSQEAAFIPLLREKGRYPGLWRAYQWVMMDGEYAAGLAELRERLSDKLIDTTGKNISSVLEGHDFGTFLRAATGKVSDVLPEEFLKKVTATPEIIIKDTTYLKNTKLPDRHIHEKTGIELVRIPAGPFLYGDDKRAIELPGFWIGRTPVTNAQYKLFVDATGHDAPYHWIVNNPPPYKLNHPVVNVTWHDAKAFCEWAGLLLPSEEQWEKAARGRDGRQWPWGNDPPTDKHCNFGKNIRTTTAVGAYSPLGDSPYGCADMAGNVWEWTKSSDNEGLSQIARGGSWWNVGIDCRCVVVDSYAMKGLDDKKGFRVLLEYSHLLGAVSEAVPASVVVRREVVSSNEGLGELEDSVLTEAIAGVGMETEDEGTVDAAVYTQVIDDAESGQTIAVILAVASKVGTLETVGNEPEEVAVMVTDAIESEDDILLLEEEAVKGAIDALVAAKDKEADEVEVTIYSGVDEKEESGKSYAAVVAIATRHGSSGDVPSSSPGVNSTD